MPEVKIDVKCTECGKEQSYLINVDNKILAPNVRSKIKPFGHISCYRITTDEIITFLTEKARSMVPGIRLTVIPRYIEKKKHRQKDTTPKPSYAFLLVAFSEEAMEDKQNYGWYGEIGSSAANIRFKKSLFDVIIKKYQYDYKKISDILKNFQSMESLEERFGMTEDFIESLKEHCKPKLIEGTDNKPWVTFAARPDAIIQDMLTSVDTGKVDGEINIMEVNAISKDLVEYLVYVLPKQAIKTQDPRVVELLSK